MIKHDSSNDMHYEQIIAICTSTAPTDKMMIAMIVNDNSNDSNYINSNDSNW